MFCHRTFVWSWCFVIAHVGYPTLTLNVIDRCDCFIIWFLAIFDMLPFNYLADVLLSDLFMFFHLYHDTLLSFSLCFTIAYLFEADVSPSHMLVILLWLSMSFVRCNVLSFDVSPSLTCYCVIIYLVFYHLICLIVSFDVLPSWLFLLS